MLFSTRSATAFTGLLCESAMMVMAFQWSPIDGYRLSLDAYVVDVPRKIQYRAIRDAENHPVAAKHTPASPTKGLWLDGNKTLSTWAKFMVPSSRRRRGLMSVRSYR